jgi:hypothetical protein
MKLKIALTLSFFFLLPTVVPAEEVGPITFSEYPVGTYIDSQYAAEGIVFGGDSPFISTDGANPTSPVLSGSPRFFGSVEGAFVDPSDGSTPAVVESFSVDAGYFDELSTTRLEWFDPDNNKLGQASNSQYGIENFHVSGGNIARWKFSIFAVEPAGYAVDNVIFNSAVASVLFREKIDSEKEGTWGFAGDEIPGFDHSALNVDNLVYESHPGYSSGTYFNDDGSESVSIISDFGVQAQHTLGTFAHDAKVAGSENSPVVDFKEVPIPLALALEMESYIEQKIASGAEFQSIDLSSAEGIEETLSPTAQKGGSNSFTCVGLVEWSAEQAGHNGGEGFIPAWAESFVYPDPSEFPPALREFPLLSPQLLYYAMRSENLISRAVEMVQGFFDPVDFLIIDPLGRRLGHTAATGTLNEIPGAFYSGNGGYEQFLIVNPIPGAYRVVFTGLGAPVYGAVSSNGKAHVTNTFLIEGEPEETNFFVPTAPGTVGDVNGDGLLDDADIVSLQLRVGTFTTGAGDPGDINGDGVITNGDVDLLRALIEANMVQKVEIDIKPGEGVNSINLEHARILPVAVLTTPDFDATEVDLSSVIFEGASPRGVGKKNKMGSFKDVDEDGDLDLMLHFPIDELTLTTSDMKGVLTGMTIDGMSIVGEDSIRAVPVTR